jgi:hypothetical protein
MRSFSLTKAIGYLTLALLIAPLSAQAQSIVRKKQGLALPNPTPTFLKSIAPLQKQTIKLQSPIQGAIITADLDGDSRPEIISSESQMGITVRSKTLNWTWKGIVGRAIPTIGDLDGDKTNEILVSHCQTEGTTKTCAIQVLKADGTPLQSFPIPGEVRGAIVLQDLDGDRKVEMILTTQNSKLVVLERDGTARKGFPKDLGDSLATTETIYAPSPAVGELDGRATNGREIVAISTGGQINVFHADGTSLPAFPIKLNEAVFASPTMGDFDGDGIGEFTVVTAKGSVRLYAPNGTIKKGFPYNVRGQVIASPLWMDLNRDGQLNLFVGTQAGFIFGLTHKGQLLPGWPRKVDGAVTGSPLAADITTNAKDELVVVTQTGAIYVFKKWGVSVAGYPVKTNQIVYATPAVADLDRNGRADILFAAHSKDLFIYEDKRLGDPQRFKGGVLFQGGASHAGSLPNVYKPANLTPQTEAPKQTKETPTNPTDPGNPNVPPKANGCNTIPTPQGSWLSLLLLGCLFLCSRKQLSLKR